VDKRYQVFVSSTFDDLREERAAVISALLQIDCFPAGMELFPAADDDSWTLIKSVIDDSDYYLIILGGRYGTLAAASARSYTHLEYEYALSVGKPTIALLHSSPGSLPADKTERDDAGRKRFDDFRADLRKKNCRLWSDRGELTAAVFTGIQHLKRTRPAVGWARVAETDERLKDELLRVRRELDEVKAGLEEARSHNEPAGTEDLAFGPEKMGIAVQSSYGEILAFDATWEEIVRAVLPLTFGAGIEDHVIVGALVSVAREKAEQAQKPFPREFWEEPTVPRSLLSKVINQMVALGLIEATPHPLSPAVTLYRATPYGAREGCRLVAVRRGVGA